MKKAAIISVLLFAAGCESLYYGTMEKFGKYKKDILVDRVQNARDAQQQTKEQFVSALDKFKSVVNVPGGKLQEKYDAQDSAIEILEKNNMWKMDVRPSYHHIINKLAGGKSEFSKAEQETLGIIAYKQPIKQSVIIKIRGNKAYDHIKKFADTGLIKKKKAGHTHELSLSDDFYDYFTFQENGTGAQESLKIRNSED